MQLGGCVRDREGGPGSKENETKEYFGRQEWWDC